LRSSGGDRGGEIIMSGSLTRPLPIAAGDAAAPDLVGVGEVRVEIAG